MKRVTCLLVFATELLDAEEFGEAGEDVYNENAINAAEELGLLVGNLVNKLQNNVKPFSVIYFC